MGNCLAFAVATGLEVSSLHAFPFLAGGESKVTQGDLTNWKSVSGVNGFEAAFEFLDRKTLADVPVGKHAIEGEQVYALVQKLSSRAPDTAQFESHRKYIDLHYLVCGLVLNEFDPAESLHLAF